MADTKQEAKDLVESKKSKATAKATEQHHRAKDLAAQKKAKAESMATEQKQKAAGNAQSQVDHSPPLQRRGNLLRATYAAQQRNLSNLLRTSLLQPLCLSTHL